MGPKSQRQKIRVLPKKTAAYRLEQTDDSKSDKRSSLHSSVKRKRLRRDEDPIIPISSLTTEPGPAVIEQRKRVIEFTVFLPFEESFPTNIMGPKSQCQQIRAPPKKTAAYRLEQPDDSKSDKSSSLHSSVMRKRLRRDEDPISSSTTEPGPAVIEERKRVLEPGATSSNLTNFKIPKVPKMSELLITQPSDLENTKLKTKDHNISEINENPDRSTTDQLPDAYESEIRTTSTLPATFDEEMVLNVCAPEPTPITTTTVLNLDGSECYPIETGHYEVIENSTTVLLNKMTKLEEILAAIFRMQQELCDSHNEVKAEVKSVRVKLERLENQNLAYEGREQWLSENGINLPMKSMEEFVIYCSFLEQASECRKLLETSVHFAINKKKSLTKNIAAVLRKYFTGELASQFTAIKFVKEKTVLGKTSFYKHMLENFLSKSAEGILPRGLTETDFNKALGEVLVNAKDWNKTKLMRQKNVEA